MDAFELRRRGVELLSPVLVPYGFVYQASEVDRGSGGLYAHGGSHERTVRWNSACAMRSVRSAIASMLPRYCTKTSPAPPWGADKRDTRGSLTIRSTASATSRRIWFASGLSSSPAPPRSEEHTSELQSQSNLVCRLLLEKKKTTKNERSYQPHHMNLCMNTCRSP